MFRVSTGYIQSMFRVCSEYDQSLVIWTWWKLVAELRERNNELQEQNSQLKLEINQLRENKKSLPHVMIPVSFFYRARPDQDLRTMENFSTTMGSGPSMLTCGENFKKKNTLHRM